jgi:hypothetical protein
MPRKNKQSNEAAVGEIRRRTRPKFSAEEKIRIVLDGLRREMSVAELCRREGIANMAGHKRVSTTTQYVHSNREQTRAVLKARPGIPVTIPVTDKKSADLNHVAEVLTIRNHNASEGGGIGRRAGFRFQCPLDVQVRVLSLALK